MHRKRTIEDCIRDIGEIPLCQCRCNRKVNVNPRYYDRYIQNGYPKFIKGHYIKINNPSKNGSWNKDTKGLMIAWNKEIPMSEEAKLKSSESHKGILLGIPKSEDHKIKIGIGVKEYLKNHPEENVNENHPSYGTHCSEERKIKQIKTLKETLKNNPEFIKRGKDHWNYQGGISSLSTEIRNCNKYKEWRLQVFNRDNFTCKECGINKVWVEAHHIKRFIKIFYDNNTTSFEQALQCQEFWDINNGITLCEDCHNKYKIVEL